MTTTSTRPAASSQPTSSIWRARGFGHYWSASTVSLAGSSVTTIVLPVVCATLLQASPTQMSVLFAVGIVAPLLLQVLVGSRADRSASPKTVMCAVDLAAGGTIALIPLLWWRDALSFPAVIVVMAVASVLGVFRSAYSLPVLLDVVPGPWLTHANGAMNASRSAMDVVGKGVAGALLTIVAAPLALLVDAVSFVVASAVGFRIRLRSSASLPGERPEEGPQPAPVGLLARRLAARRDLWILVVISFVNGLMEAVFLLFALRNLDLAPALVAGSFGVGAVGGVIGGLSVARVVQAGGRRSAVIVGMTGTIGSVALLPFVGPGAGALVAVVLFEFLGAFGGTVAVAAVFSDIQQTAAPRSVARTMAMTDNALQLSMLAGLLLGGRLGDATSLVTPIVVCLGVLVLVGVPLTAMAAVDTPSARRESRST